MKSEFCEFLIDDGHEWPLILMCDSINRKTKGVNRELSLPITVRLATDFIHYKLCETHDTDTVYIKQ